MLPGFRACKCVQIVATDKDGAILDAMETNQTLADAIAVVGVHSDPTPQDGARVAALGKRYWQSENNLVDGPMFPDGKYDTALSWVARILSNYVASNATSTIQCPLFHAWSQNLARHNHGSAYFADPWSGYFEVGSPWWAQAHIMQFAPIGWRLALVGHGSDELANNGSTLTFVTFVSPEQADFSIVVVNQGASVPNVSVSISAAGGVPFGGGSLRVWESLRGTVFQQAESVQVVEGRFARALSADSIYTFTTLSRGSHPALSTPARAPFPTPYQNDFEEQGVPGPGLYLSDAWGAFEVFAAAPGNKVLRSSVPACPIGWGQMDRDTGHCDQLPPYTMFPTGTNWMNYEVAVNVSLAPAAQNVSPVPIEAFVCGRTPIWPLRAETLLMSPPIGVCMTVNQTHWWVDERDNERAVVLAIGRLASPQPWQALSLTFEDYDVAARLDGAVVAASLPTRLTNGVAGLGTQYHLAYFDNLALRPVREAALGSFLLDITPQRADVPSVWRNFTGWAGAVWNLTDPGLSPPQATVLGLGRFKAPGNSNAHELAVFRASDGRRMSPTSVSVDLATCNADLLGFCYAMLSSPLLLPAGDAYFVVAQEAAGGDAILEMTDPASASTMANRIATTLMTYQGPNWGHVAGRVWQQAGSDSWLVVPEQDTMYGPVNWLLGQQ
jgi:hypothetical protein